MERASIETRRVPDRSPVADRPPIAGTAADGPKAFRDGELAHPDHGPAAAWWRGALIGAAALALALGSLVLVWLLAHPLALLFAAIVIAEALSPLVARLERWRPRTLALAAVVGVAWLVVPPLVAQGTELVVRTPELSGLTKVVG